MIVCGELKHVKYIAITLLHNLGKNNKLSNPCLSIKCYFRTAAIKYRFILLILICISHSGGGTGPADPASAGPIISRTTDTHAHIIKLASSLKIPYQFVTKTLVRFHQRRVLCQFQWNLF